MTTDQLVVRHLGGAEALAALAAADDFLHKHAAPVSARAPWLVEWAETHSPQWRPFVVTVHDGYDLAGLAALAVTRRGPVTDVVMLGHGLSDYAVLAATDRRAVVRLATGLIGFLARQARPWRLRLEQLPAGDPTASMVAAALPHAQLLPGTPTPRMALSPDDRTLRSHIGRKLHQDWNRARRRIDRLPHELRTTRDPHQITAALDAVIGLHRARDHEVGRRSVLDDGAEQAFYRNVVTLLADRGEVELTGLWLEGALAGYALCLLDGDVYRGWDGRMDSRWAELGVGRLCQVAAVESALADPRFTAFDLMRGTSTFKDKLAGRQVEQEHLFAASSASVWWAWQAAARAREVARRSLPASVRNALR